MLICVRISGIHFFKYLNIVYLIRDIVFILNIKSDKIYNC